MSLPIKRSSFWFHFFIFEFISRSRMQSFKFNIYLPLWFFLVFSNVKWDFTTYDLFMTLRITSFFKEKMFQTTFSSYFFLKLIFLFHRSPSLPLFFQSNFRNNIFRFYFYFPLFLTYADERRTSPENVILRWANKNAKKKKPQQIPVFHALYRYLVASNTLV